MIGMLQIGCQSEVVVHVSTQHRLAQKVYYEKQRYIGICHRRHFEIVQ